MVLFIAISTLHVPLPSLRSANESFILVPSAFNTRIGQNSLTHYGFKLWNDLPNVLRSIPSILVSKSELKTNLLTS